MPPKSAADTLTAIATHERATPSLVYRSLLRSIHDGHMVPGARLPNERDLAQRLNTSRTAVRSALAMMERQGLIHRRVGSGTFLADDAESIFSRMDQTAIGIARQRAELRRDRRGTAPVRAGDDGSRRQPRGGARDRRDAADPRRRSSRRRPGTTSRSASTRCTRRSSPRPRTSS